MKHIFSALQLYALSLIFSTGLFLAIVVGRLEWVADTQGLPVPWSAQISVLSNALSMIGVGSFLFCILFALLGITIDRIKSSIGQIPPRHNTETSEEQSMMASFPPEMRTPETVRALARFPAE